jgi:DNA-binding ferritin-like protein
MSSRDVAFFFQMRTQIKLYHWQTRLYSRHKASDNVLEKLDELIDKYVEVYIGKYGRPKLDASTNTTTVQNLSESSVIKYMHKYITYMTEPLVKRLKKEDTDLLSLRDDMIAELNQLLYLFTLK